MSRTMGAKNAPKSKVTKVKHPQQQMCVAAEKGSSKRNSSKSGS